MILLIGLFLGQSIITASDIHIVFEQSNTHHLSDSHVKQAGDNQTHLGDDCGHSCHSHGLNIVLLPADSPSLKVASQDPIDNYQPRAHSLALAPFLKPPIA